MAAKNAPQTNVTAESDPIEFPFGEGAMVVSSASGLTSAVKICIGNDIWVPDKDATAPNDDGAFAIDIGGPGYARLDVSAGSCTVQFSPQMGEKYK